ncbi:hypothetical protein COB64_02865 [Candidatus Wolfebacteria bacterium]|nr:MAG: hypothetical protein COB64_02865 [Candidatus Wolfebacteria bacterium]
MTYTIKRFIISISFLCLFLLPFISLHAAGEIDNIGFIQRNIWYSKDPFTEGDSIMIFTGLFNSGPSSISGTVEFFDKNILLGDTDFSFESGTSGVVSIEWNVTSGDHVISAKITNSKIINENNELEDVTVQFNTSDQDRSFVSKKLSNVDLDDLIGEDLSDTFDTVQDFIDENTPDFVGEEIGTRIGILDTWRQNTSTSLTTQADEVSKKIERLKKDPEISGEGLSIKDKIGSSNILLNPFQYIKLFILKALSFIFKFKLLFYGLIFLLLLLLARFIKRRMSH